MENEILADRLRTALASTKNVEEKKMFGGICFMINGKMSVCARRNSEIMCRVGPDQFPLAITKKGARPMVHNGRQMTGYVFVEVDAIGTKKELDYWVRLCLDYNKDAKSSKKSAVKKTTLKKLGGGSTRKAGKSSRTPARGTTRAARARA